MNFECLKGTPAHDSVRAALAQVGQARTWVPDATQFALVRMRIRP